MMGYLQQLMAWIAALDPAQAFLFALPFLVAAAGLARSGFDERQRNADPLPGPLPRQRENF